MTKLFRSFSYFFLFLKLQVTVDILTRIVPLKIQIASKERPPHKNCLKTKLIFEHVHHFHFGTAENQ